MLLLVSRQLWENDIPSQVMSLCPALCTKDAVQVDVTSPVAESEPKGRGGKLGKLTGRVTESGLPRTTAAMHVIMTTHEEVRAIVWRHFLFHCYQLYSWSPESRD